MLLTSSLAKSGLACNHRLKMFCLGLETVTPLSSQQPMMLPLTRHERSVRSRVNGTKRLDHHSQRTDQKLTCPVNLLTYNRTEYPHVMPDASKFGFSILHFEGINIVARNAEKEFVSIPVGVMLLEILTYAHVVSYAYVVGCIFVSNGSLFSFPVVDSLIKIVLERFTAAIRMVPERCKGGIHRLW
ncbi:unnamed protein product [Cylicocyclus nassatus]|uniref:Uncharacterized protein n=1 Tax=Cylicocyclus nassatus TaxID=53992 RepID=A0AA36H6I3_CYLNA|nr:unnamed protein product [Cylicocyclus nassatus]